VGGRGTANVNVPPFDANPFWRPTKCARERHDEMCNQLVLAWGLAEGLAEPAVALGIADIATNHAGYDRARSA
jgi:hypothetical protein